MYIKSARSLRVNKHPHSTCVCLYARDNPPRYVTGASPLDHAWQVDVGTLLPWWIMEAILQMDAWRQVDR